MDGEMVPELRDPRQCILSSGPVMAASYMLPDRQDKCARIAEDVHNQLRLEQANCVKYTPSPTVTGTSSDSSSCSEPRTVVVYRGNRTCLSMQTVVECKSSCEPVDTMAKNVCEQNVFV